MKTTKLVIVSILLTIATVTTAEVVDDRTLQPIYTPTRFMGGSLIITPCNDCPKIDLESECSKRAEAEARAKEREECVDAIKAIFDGAVLPYADDRMRSSTIMWVVRQKCKSYKDLLLGALEGK